MRHVPGEVAAGGKPICVTGCPMRALDFGTREEMMEKYGEGDVEVEPLPPTPRARTSS